MNILKAHIERLNKEMVESGCDPADITGFNGGWWAGAYDMMHLIIDALKVNDQEKLHAMHVELHDFVVSVDEEEEHAKH